MKNIFSLSVMSCLFVSTMATAQQASAPSTKNQIEQQKIKIARMGLELARAEVQEYPTMSGLELGSSVLLNTYGAVKECPVGVLNLILDMVKDINAQSKTIPAKEEASAKAKSIAQITAAKLMNLNYGTATLINCQAEGYRTVYSFGEAFGRAPGAFDRASQYLTDKMEQAANSR